MPVASNFYFTAKATSIQLYGPNNHYERTLTRRHSSHQARLPKAIGVRTARQLTDDRSPVKPYKQTQKMRSKLKRWLRIGIGMALTIDKFLFVELLFPILNFSDVRFGTGRPKWYLVRLFLLVLMESVALE